MIWWLVAILAVVGALIAFFIIISWALGCGTLTGCIDVFGLGDLFARFPFLSVCCVAFVIFGAMAAILGATYWHAIFERRRDRGEHVRKRFPPD